MDKENKQNYNRIKEEISRIYAHFTEKGQRIEDVMKENGYWGIWRYSNIPHMEGVVETIKKLRAIEEGACVVAIPAELVLGDFKEIIKKDMKPWVFYVKVPSLCRLLGFC